MLGWFIICPWLIPIFVGFLILGSFVGMLRWASRMGWRRATFSECPSLAAGCLLSLGGGFLVGRWFLGEGNIKFLLAMIDGLAIWVWSKVSYFIVEAIGYMGIAVCLLAFLWALGATSDWPIGKPGRERILLLFAIIGSGLAYVWMTNWPPMVFPLIWLVGGCGWLYGFLKGKKLGEGEGEQRGLAKAKESYAQLFSGGDAEVAVKLSGEIARMVKDSKVVRRHMIEALSSVSGFEAVSRFAMALDRREARRRAGLPPNEVQSG